METLVLPFGGGLDRQSGVMATRPGTMADLRNVRPLGTRMKVRRGTRETVRLPSQDGNPCTHIVGIQSIRSLGEALVCGYYKNSREVHVYRVSGAGLGPPHHIGLWFTLHDNADSPPVILSAESYGQAYLAHDERRVTLRTATQIYSSSAGTMADLEADLNGDGDAPVKFRGVTTWMNYLVGWGWGTPDDVRPEIVRVSKPGEPSSFLPDSYWIAGDRGAPVTACAQASGTLLVLKPTETYRIVGTHAENFGILPLFTLYGAVASRLAISIENTCYAWGLEGPWMASLDGSSDMESPLNLERPPPGDLPPQGDVQTGFGVYVPSDRTLEWHFGERVYAYSLEAGAWSYRTRPQEAFSGALLYSSRHLGVIDDGPVGHAYPIEVEGSILTWENHQQDGDEQVETHLLDNGRWNQLPDVKPTLDNTQTRDLAEWLSTGVQYTVAMCYRRTQRYGPDYQSDHPPDWPEDSRLTFTAGEVDTTPVEAIILSAAWSRIGENSEQVLLEVQGDATRSHALLRDDEEIARNEVGSVVEQTGPVRFQFTDQEPVGETHEVYKVVPYVNDVAGDESRERHVWIGPEKPLSVRYVAVDNPGDEPPPGTGQVRITWGQPPADTIAQVRVNRSTNYYEVDGRSYELFVPVNPVIDVRFVQTAYGKRDYSPWATANDETDPGDPE